MCDTHTHAHTHIYKTSILKNDQNSKDYRDEQKWEECGLGSMLKGPVAQESKASTVWNVCEDREDFEVRKMNSKSGVSHLKSAPASFHPDPLWSPSCPLQSFLGESQAHPPGKPHLASASPGSAI